MDGVVQSEFSPDRTDKRPTDIPSCKPAPLLSNYVQQGHGAGPDPRRKFRCPDHRDSADCRIKRVDGLVTGRSLAKR